LFVGRMSFLTPAQHCDGSVVNHNRYRANTAGSLQFCELALKVLLPGSWWEVPTSFS